MALDDTKEAHELNWINAALLVSYKENENTVYVCKSSRQCVRWTFSVRGTADGNTSWGVCVLSDRLSGPHSWLA